MGDDYFTMDSSSNPYAWAPLDRGSLLEGVCDDLLDGANNALDGIETLRAADANPMFGDVGGLFQKMADQTSASYREFSTANLDRDSGLQSLIDHYERIWKKLHEDSATPLDQAEKRLEYWRGDAANAAKMYVGQLAQAYLDVESKITVLESDVVAAREAIASARHDLNELGLSLKQTAEKYKEQKHLQAVNARNKVLAAAFAATVTSLLAVATAGAGVTTAVVVAQGTSIAANAAGTWITETVASEISGDSSYTIFDSFTKAVDKIRSTMQDTSSDLAGDIHAQADDRPDIPKPPDVSPGDRFDPDNFEAEHATRKIEDGVRQENVDIAPDGKVSKVSAALDG